MHHEKLADKMEFPPETPQPNVYPLSWHCQTEKLEEVWDASQREYWDPKKLPWKQLGVDVSALQELAHTPVLGHGRPVGEVRATI